MTPNKLAILTIAILIIIAFMTGLVVGWKSCMKIKVLTIVESSSRMEVQRWVG